MKHNPPLCCKKIGNDNSVSLNQREETHPKKPDVATSCKRICCTAGGRGPKDWAFKKRIEGGRSHPHYHNDGCSNLFNKNIWDYCSPKWT